MTNIAALAVDEPVRVDAKRVGDIINELGEQAAQEIIEMTLEQMAVVLGKIEGAKDREALRQSADRIARMAWQVGLVSLSGIAVDVGQCARHGNDTALRATTARLMRVGNRSLTQIWDASSWP